jgi:hypothetical protein
MYWLLESEPVIVQAWTLPTGAKEPIGENNVVAAFQFADGSIGSLTYCTVGSTASAASERVEVFAPGIRVIAEDFKRLTSEGRSATRRGSWFAKKGYDAQMTAFLAAIRNPNASAVGPRDGARATVACLELLESARTGQPRAIELDRTLGGE